MKVINRQVNRTVFSLQRGSKGQHVMQESPATERSSPFLRILHIPPLRGTSSAPKSPRKFDSDASDAPVRRQSPRLRDSTHRQRTSAAGPRNRPDRTGRRCSRSPAFEVSSVPKTKERRQPLGCKAQLVGVRANLLDLFSPSLPGDGSEDLGTVSLGSEILPTEHDQLLGHDEHDNEHDDEHDTCKEWLNRCGASSASCLHWENGSMFKRPDNSSPSARNRPGGELIPFRPWYVCRVLGFLFPTEAP